MTKKTLFRIGVCIALGAFVFTACDSFYNDSWGSQRKYAPKELNADNVGELVDASVGNPELALALAKKVRDTVKGMDDSRRDKAKLQAAGVELVFEASGLGTSLLSHIDKALGVVEARDKDADIEPALVKLLNSVRADFDFSVADILVAIVQPREGFQGDIPQFAESYKQTASASNVGEATMILILATMGETHEIASLHDELETKFRVERTPDMPTLFEVSSGADSKDRALAAYLNCVFGDGTGRFEKNPITKGLLDAIN